MADTAARAYANMGALLGRPYHGKVDIDTFGGPVWSIKNSCVGTANAVVGRLDLPVNPDIAESNTRYASRRGFVAQMSRFIHCFRNGGSAETILPSTAAAPSSRTNLIPLADFLGHSDAYFSHRRRFSVLPLSDMVQGVVARTAAGAPDELLADAGGRRPTIDGHTDWPRCPMSP